MDFKDSEIKDNKQTNILEANPLKTTEPIITFSPNRTRFENQSKSRNTSIDSDFEINLEVSHSKADIKLNQFEHQPGPSTSLTDLLSKSSSIGNSSILQLLKSSKSGATDDDDDIINHFNLDLKQELSLNLLNRGHDNQDQKRESNVTNSPTTDVDSSCPSLSTLVTTTKGPRKMSNGTGLLTTGVESTPPSNTTPPISSNIPSTVQLQKKLEKKIKQASCISATMNSMSSTSSSNLMSSLSQKDDMEFGEWSSNSPSITNEPSSAQASHSSKSLLSKSSTSSTKTKNNATKPRYSSSSLEDRKPACVKFQENEVEIISKSSRNSKTPGSLLPANRLAIPHKNLVANNKSNANNNRKHHLSSNRGGVNNAEGEENPSQQHILEDEGIGGNLNSTSEVKPLVEWDSDDSEEELSFFPTGNPKAKLTDNLSIDNMSLSGEEDDLHLSPPRAIIQKCPCDPRQWISDHVNKLPKSNSFPGQGGQCLIS